MTDLSTITEEQLVISKDKLTAIRYKVVAETIDLQALKAEKENLEAELNMKEPSNEELIEMGKMMHPFYQRNADWINTRILEIDKFLGE
jgi:hypothetical protein